MHVQESACAAASLQRPRPRGEKRGHKRDSGRARSRQTRGTSAAHLPRGCRAGPLGDKGDAHDRFARFGSSVPDRVGFLPSSGGVHEVHYPVQFDLRPLPQGSGSWVVSCVGHGEGFDSVPGGWVFGVRVGVCGESVCQFLGSQAQFRPLYPDG